MHGTLLDTLHQLRSFILLVLGFGFVIFVHELGHFLAAKAVGIKVTQFAIGFGPSIFSFRKGIGFRFGSTEEEYAKRLQAQTASDSSTQTAESHHPAAMSETEYRLNWFPLGGYVKMLGQEDMDPSAVSDDERAFNRKPIWARATVISAGVIMNLIFGVVFFIIAFMMGVGFNPSIVGDVQLDSPASKAYAQGHEGDPKYKGLKPGDKVLSINGEAVSDFADMRVNVALANNPITAVVQRDTPDGTGERLTYVMESQRDAQMQLYSLGISPVSDTLLNPKLDAEDLPAILRQAGVTKGMRVLAVDGQPVKIKDYPHFDSLVSARQGNPAQVTFGFDDPARKDEARQVTLCAEPDLLMQEITSATNNQSPIYMQHMIGFLPVMKVEEPMPQSAAMAAGFLEGDVIARVGAVQWPTISRFIDVVSASKGKKLDVQVLRGKELVTLTVTPGRDGRIGVRPGYALEINRVGDVLPGSPAATLQINPGTEVLSINGETVHNYGDMQRLLAAAVSAKLTAVSPSTQPAPSSVTIGYRLAVADQQPSTAAVTIPPEMVSELAQAQWRQPLPAFVFKTRLDEIKATSPLEAASIGIHKTGNFIVQTYLTVSALIRGRVPLNQMSGPVGIAHKGTQITNEGLSYLFWFLGLISANLAVINFLPIPVVDGGLMVMLIIEKIKGSPVSPKIQVAVTYAGLALILSLFLYITYHDVARLVG